MSTAFFWVSTLCLVIESSSSFWALAIIFLSLLFSGALLSKEFSASTATSKAACTGFASFWAASNIARLGNKLIRVASVSNFFCFFLALSSGVTDVVFIPPTTLGTRGIKNPAAAASIYSLTASLSVKGKSAPNLSNPDCTASTGASFIPVIPTFFTVLSNMFWVGLAKLSNAPKPILIPT